MRWLALVVGLYAACSLLSCGAQPDAPKVVAPAATVEPEREPPPVAPATTVTSRPQPSVTPPATSSPTRAPTATLLPTSTPTQAPTTTPLPTPAPALPPLLPAAKGEPLALSLGWQFNANGHLTAGAQSDGAGRHAYVLTSLGRALYVVADSGKLDWSARAAGPIYALALLDGNRIVTGDDAGVVALFDPRGQLLWQVTLPGRITGLEAWLDGLLVAGWNERLTFLNTGADDERIRWQADLGGPIGAVTTAPGLALAATFDGSLWAVDEMGTVVWRVDAGAPIAHLDAGAGGGVLVGLQDGRLLALDPGGTILWQQVFGTGAAGSPVWQVADLDRSGLPEIVAGTGGDDPVLALLDADGQVLWRVAVPSPVQAVTATDLDRDGTTEIFAGLASGEIVAYDRQGRQRGSVHAGLPVWGLETGKQDPAGQGAVGPVLVRADVVAWRLQAGPGKAGGPWLPPPDRFELGADPLTSTVERKEGEAILVFLGDVAPGRSMEAQLARYGPDYPWGGLEPLLSDADLAMANLECVLSTRGEPLQKPYLLRAHPRWGQSLVEAGIDLVSLANNHALDFGPEGLDETLDTLAAVDIAGVGAGRTAIEAHRPALLTAEGVKVAVLGYAAPRWNGSEDVPATDRLAWAVPGDIEADVRAVRKAADLVVVLLHAGTEYAAQPSPDQVAAAHAAIDAGADLVVGHHPHVTQTIEKYKQGLIVYSLGDAVFDIPRPAAMRGHLLRVHVTRTGLAQAELWPFWIEDAIRPRLLEGRQGAPQVTIIFP